MEGYTNSIPLLEGKVQNIPKPDKTLKREGFPAEAKAVGEALNKKIDAEDIVNNVETEDAGKPLSAAMGKYLAELARGVGSNFADNVVYDNSDSGLDAHDVQYAITLLAHKLRDVLSLDGGTMRGEDFYMDGGNVRLQGNENAFWLQVLNEAMNLENRRLLALYNSNYASDLRQALKVESIIGGSKTEHLIYGEHNKRSGVYTGSGSTASRQIDTKSYGNLIIIFSSNGMAMAHPTGGIVFSGTSCAVKSQAELSYTNGILTIANASKECNQSGIPYMYQAL